MEKRINVVKCLVKYNASVNIRDKAGCTPLYLACAHNELEMVEMLINTGADTEIPDNGLHTTTGLCQHGW